MATKVVTLDDGTRVEIEVSEDQAQQISGGLDGIKGTFDKVHPILVKTCRPIVNAWNELSREMTIEQAEVEIGLSFEGEGNLFVTKSKAGANLSIKLVLKPKQDKGDAG